MGEPSLFFIVGFFAKLPVSFNKVRIPQRIDTVKRNNATNINQTFELAEEGNNLSVNAIHNVNIPIDKVIICLVTSPAKSNVLFSLSSIICS